MQEKYRVSEFLDAHNLERPQSAQVARVLQGAGQVLGNEGFPDQHSTVVVEITVAHNERINLPMLLKTIWKSPADRQHPAGPDDG